MNSNTLVVTYYLANQLSKQIEIIVTNRGQRVYHLSTEVYQLKGQEHLFISTLDELLRLKITISEHKKFEKVTNKLDLSKKFQLNPSINGDRESTFMQVYRLAQCLCTELKTLANEFNIDLDQWTDSTDLFNRGIGIGFNSVCKFRDYMYFN